MHKRGPKQLTRNARFEMRVNRGGGADSCHLWKLKPIKRGGYGVFYDDDGRHRRAHVIAWELARGPVPAGSVVCHRCDNPRCVNPAHLFLGSQADNLLDMHAKGRSNRDDRERGEDRYNARLTEDVVRNLRLERAAGRTNRELAAELGLSISAVQQAVARRTWKHVS